MYNFLENNISDAISVKNSSVLNGTIDNSGSKNAALPIIISSILLNNRNIMLNNVPDILDVRITLDILSSIGVQVKYDNSALNLHATNEVLNNIPADFAIKLRASSLFLGVMITKFGNCTLPPTGGCNIENNKNSPRSLDVHIDVLQKLKIKINEKQDGSIHAVLSEEERNSLEEVTIEIPIISVGATENAIFASLAFKKKITLKNIALEPEVIDLIQFLLKASFNIQYDSVNRMVKINHIENTIPTTGQLNYTIIPDRIEASSYLLAAVATRGKVTINNCITRHFFSVIKILIKLGVVMQIKSKEIKIIGYKPQSQEKNIFITTSPYPNIPTDIQPILTVALSTFTNIRSYVKDEVYPNRFNYVNDLVIMGANIENLNKEHFSICINKNFSSSCFSKKTDDEFNVPDLRAGFSILIAGMLSKYPVRIKNFKKVYRGYENILQKLQKCGVEIDSDTG